MFFQRCVRTFEHVTEQIGSVSENTFAGPIFTKIISGVFTNKHLTKKGNFPMIIFLFAGFKTSNTKTQKHPEQQQKENVNRRLSAVSIQCN